MKKAVTALFLVLALVGGWLYRSQPKRQEDRREDWKFVRQGPRVILTIEASKAEYRLNEDIWVSFKFKNLSTEEHFTILNETLGFQFTDPAYAGIGGNGISQMDPGSSSGALNSVDIGPQETTEHKVRLNQWKLTKPGPYVGPRSYIGIGKEARTIQVTGSYHPQNGATVKGAPLWYSTLVSEPIQIRINK